MFRLIYCLAVSCVIGCPPPAPAPASEARKECFHRNSQVITDQGPLTMQELAHKKNVKVEALNEKNEVILSPVRIWGHADHDQTSDGFLQIITESGHEIELTANHLIYTTNCDDVTKLTKPGAEVVRGDCLVVTEKGAVVPSKVVEIIQVQKVGLYAPITQHGNIIVNNVSASCYASLHGEVAVHQFMLNVMNVFDYLPTSQIVEQSWWPAAAQNLLSIADRFSV